MATVSDLNQQISSIESALNATRDQISQRLRSIANVNPNLQMNAAYLARLNAEVAQLTATAAVQQQALDAAVIERNQAQQTAQTKVSPATDQQADRTVQYADAAQTPPYDDNGYLNPGWQINPESGQPFYTGNTVQSTTAAALNPDDDPFEAARREAEQNQNLESPTESAVNVGDEDPEVANLREQAQEINRAQLAQEAKDVEPGAGTGYGPTTATGGVAYDDDGNLLPGYTLDENNNPVYVGGDFVEPATIASAEASRLAAGRNEAQNQSTNQARVNAPSAADWRVRISLAETANYLYRAGTNQQELGILAPLRDTDGVIFPYTPTIETSYQAKYQNVDLVHSNYRGQFYQNSFTDAISIKGVFTAQDTYEAAYLLAVIHFFKSVTKMFYGQDTQAGTPPPLVFLSGLGQYQFNKHPCVVSNFQYSLPPDVDYIRANGFNNIGVNMENRLNKSSGPGPGGLLDFVKNKLGLNKLPIGGIPQVPNPSILQQNITNNSAVNSTYVPTKMTINVTLLPIQTRSQMSKQFSVKSFANGSLLQDGFW